MIAIQKFVKDDQNVRRFICMAVNLYDTATAEACAQSMSAQWAPTTPEEGIYIYDPTTNIASAKYVNGIKVW